MKARSRNLNDRVCRIAAALSLAITAVPAVAQRPSLMGDILQVDTYPLTIYSAAAIQELRAEKDAEIERQNEQIQTLASEVKELKRLVDVLATGKGAK